MRLFDTLLAPNFAAARIFETIHAPLALATRLYVSWQFLKAGWNKLTHWETTLWLFENEYRTPILSPTIAAVAGTFGELLFPALLLIGLAGRLSAAGLFAVNVVAVISYQHFLFSEGAEAALGQHYLWGLMTLMLMVYGPGRWSLDYLLTRKT